MSAIITTAGDPTRCQICGRLLGNLEDPRSEDCGGDCLQCMAEAGDPDCAEAIRKIEASEAKQ